jgi:uncharacterized membrane protein YkoI
MGSHRRPLAAFLFCAALAFTGCSGGDDAATPGRTATPAPSSAAPASESPSAGSSDRADVRAVSAAGRMALEAVPGGTVTSVEAERGGSAWEVHVVTADGTSHEVAVSADGSKVLATPTAEADDAADRAKHRDRAKAATVDFAKAASIAAVHGTQLRELELDTQGGRTVWEADVVDDARGKHKVTIDAGTGEVISVAPHTH